MIDAFEHLVCPLGQAGSGRVRYGAAMALWRDGQMSEAQLEVYRIAAAHDGRDPAIMLAERGLPTPGCKAAELLPLERLYRAARTHLLALDHPGAAELRAALPLAPRRAAPHVAEDAAAQAVAAQWLDAARHAMALAQTALSDAIATAAPQLRWTHHAAFAGRDFGALLAANHAYAPLVGGDDKASALGLLLIAPGQLLRDHRHLGATLYVPLTGLQRWRFGPARNLMAKAAPSPIWLAPDRPFLAQTGRVPFLALLYRAQAADLPARIIPATDWADLEKDQHV